MWNTSWSIREVKNTKHTKANVGLMIRCCLPKQWSNGGIRPGYNQSLQFDDQSKSEIGGAKFDHGSGGIVLLRAA
ncbi:hypothetical protein [Notoacmeibacter marinus]|uniref:hypothetical protein n=1 Tax=Notoacmeibacter marinus TaxID=1876515 RepID=UPI0013B0569C|nr:hypothetical protein [Notoacmeibacter marinus]